MTEPRVRGHTKSGRAITDKDVEKLAAEAEAGYDVDALIARRNKRGLHRSAMLRPAWSPSGSTLNCALLERAQSEDTTPSELIREALRRYLHAA